MDDEIKELIDLLKLILQKMGDDTKQTKEKKKREPKNPKKVKSNHNVIIETDKAKCLLNTE